MALLLCFALPMMAQNKKEEARVQLAREKYAERLEQIAEIKAYEEDEIPAVNYTSVVRKQNWAGGGQSVDKMDFYYHEIEDDMEPYPVGYTLVMVRRVYNAGSTDHFEEYVYDDEGNPLFWYKRYGYSKEDMVELRGYYDANGQCIRTICKRHITAIFQDFSRRTAAGDVEIAADVDGGAVRISAEIYDCTVSGFNAHGIHGIGFADKPNPPFAIIDVCILFQISYDCAFV